MAVQLPARVDIELATDVSWPINTTSQVLHVFVIESSNGPSDTDTQEDIHSVTTRYVTHRGVSVLILDGCDFAGKGICFRLMGDASGYKKENVLFSDFHYLKK